MADRSRRGGRGPEWRGDEGFGGGWGNQVPRAHFDADAERYGPGASPGHGDDNWYGPGIAFRDYRYGGPGLDGEPGGGARFGQAGVGQADARSAWPVASPSNLGYGMGARDTFAGSARDYAIRHDPHYADWRHRQMADLDRDFDEYRRERQTRFDREFGEWRSRREEQRASLRRIGARMEVVGCDGGHVGTVDCTSGDRIVLARSDEGAGGVHHLIPCGWIDRVEDKVVLNLDADEARRRWESENRGRALFERERTGGRGPHMLNRSFAGTYPDEE